MTVVSFPGRDPQRQMPHSEEAEQALLGAILIDNRVLDRVSDRLRPEHFHYPVHARVYAACIALRDQGRVADTATLKAHFAEDGDLDQVGGGQYLVDLTTAPLSVSQAHDYARLVRDLHLRREIVRICDEVAYQAGSATGEIQDGSTMLAEAEERLYTLGNSGRAATRTSSLTDAMDRVISTAVQAADARAKGEPPQAIVSGLADLDRRIGGFWPGEVTIIGARPSMGKTALAQHIALNAAQAGVGVLFASLEMTGEQIAERLFQREIGVSATALRRGDLEQATIDHLYETRRQHDAWPIQILGAGTSIAAIARQARQMKRRNDRVLIVVDYLQLLDPPQQQRDGNRVADMSAISRALKLAAGETGCPLIALSQLSRLVEQRPNKRPQLSDLRESGAIEQDADVVTFLYREEYYLERVEPDEADPERSEWERKLDACRHVCELGIAKQRMGPTGVVRVHFDAASGRFSNLAQQEQMREMV